MKLFCATLALMASMSAAAIAAPLSMPEGSGQTFDEPAAATDAPYCSGEAATAGKDCSAVLAWHRRWHRPHCWTRCRYIGPIKRCRRVCR